MRGVRAVASREAVQEGQRGSARASQGNAAIGEGACDPVVSPPRYQSKPPESRRFRGLPLSGLDPKWWDGGGTREAAGADRRAISGGSSAMLGCPQSAWRAGECRSAASDSPPMSPPFPDLVPRKFTRLHPPRKPQPRKTRVKHTIASGSIRPPSTQVRRVQTQSPQPGVRKAHAGRGFFRARAKSPSIGAWRAPGNDSAAKVLGDDALRTIARAGSPPSAPTSPRAPAGTPPRTTATRRRRDAAHANAVAIGHA
jgi:hypothetical protein